MKTPQTSSIKQAEAKTLAFLSKWQITIARAALFIIYFWFGFLKVIDISPATPLAESLATKTIGADLFPAAFWLLAVFECVIGVLFLIPKATRHAVVLLLIHMAVVCSPLLLLPGEAWQNWFVPTLEGQYIIKNVALVALAFIIATTTLLPQKRSK